MACGWPEIDSLDGTRNEYVYALTVETTHKRRQFTNPDTKLVGTKALGIIDGIAGDAALKINDR